MTAENNELHQLRMRVAFLEGWVEGVCRAREWPVPAHFPASISVKADLLPLDLRKYGALHKEAS